MIHYPLAAHDEADSHFVYGEGVPGIAAIINDALIIVEQTMGQLRAAKILLSVLDEIELRSIGRQLDQADVLGDNQLVADTPAHSAGVQDRDGATVVFDKDHVHHVSISRRYNSTSVDILLRVNGDQAQRPLKQALSRQVRAIPQTAHPSYARILLSKGGAEATLDAEPKVPRIHPGDRAMYRLIMSALAMATMSFAGSAVQAQSTELTVGGRNYEVRLVITEKMINNDAEYSRGRLGFYVFIASAHTDSVIDVQAIENATVCTTVRPRFGLTKPTTGYFKFPAYAVYYGPYASISEAQEAKKAIGYCVQDAYISAGVVQRF